MGLNVTGSEVASGIYDPSTMFMVVGGLVVAGLILYAIYSLIK